MTCLSSGAGPDCAPATAPVARADPDGFTPRRSTGPETPNEAFPSPAPTPIDVPRPTVAIAAAGTGRPAHWPAGPLAPAVLAAPPRP